MALKPRNNTRAQALGEHLAITEFRLRHGQFTNRLRWGFVKAELDRIQGEARKRRRGLARRGH
jgi:hypothetical protein